MIKLTLTIVIFSLWSSSSFASGCERWEYVKLKDSTKKELSDEYCTSVAGAIAGSKMAAARNAAAKKSLELGFSGSSLKHNNDAYESSMDQVSCMKQVEDSEEMLMKKFKAKPPLKCMQDYKREIPST